MKQAYLFYIDKQYTSFNTEVKVAYLRNISNHIHKICTFKLPMEMGLLILGLFGNIFILKIKLFHANFKYI